MISLIPLVSAAPDKCEEAIRDAASLNPEQMRRMCLSDTFTGVSERIKEACASSSWFGLGGDYYDEDKVKRILAKSDYCPLVSVCHCLISFDQQRFLGNDREGNPIFGEVQQQEVLLKKMQRLRVDYSTRIPEAYPDVVQGTKYIYCWAEPNVEYDAERDVVVNSKFAKLDDLRHPPLISYGEKGEGYPVTITGYSVQGVLSEACEETSGGINARPELAFPGIADDDTIGSRPVPEFSFFAMTVTITLALTLLFAFKKMTRK